MRIFHNYYDIYLYIDPLTDDEANARIQHQISNCFCFLEDYLNLTTNQYMRVKENKEEIALTGSSYLGTPRYSQYLIW